VLLGADTDGFFSEVGIATVRKGSIIVGQTAVISIIDDDASVRIAADRLVRASGYAAHTFASAEEFLSSPLRDATSCVVTDIQMPGMSGLDLQALLRAQGDPLPIIFITAFPEDNIRARAIEGGAVCLLAKPFDGTMLITQIEAALETHGHEADH
jgi:FixJ family two-component response regulator